ncbi:P-loop containing nucleoside triphosphate hydrolase protein [Ganoderma leucocontextum]|nr:P-loop containing nucleoside triphosphate hydrolase protein [Ganoderma leucocontextum]
MSSSAGARFLFSTPAGFRLVRETLATHISYEPHDWQLEGVCKMLDGRDLVAILPTGAGKTSYFTMFMLMLVELSQNPSLRNPALPIPCDPCMIIVYPTNGLEEEQAHVFVNVGLKTLVINAETLSVARQSGEDIWLTARIGITMILLSPEQLSTRGFKLLIQHRPFQSRFRAFGVDEIHLLNSWGLAFRQAFRQLGHARARLPSHIFIGTSATMLAGDATASIYTFLGLHPGTFYIIQRSNLRRNVCTIFRTLTHGIGGWSVFPDLKWILESKHKTVIHCRTIALGFRLALYLWHLLPSNVNRARFLRLYNALNWMPYNVETGRLMREDPEMRIIIATATFMVGIDLPNIHDVILLGALESADEHVQWEGRAGRNMELVSDGHCITYVMSKSLDVARALCAGKAPAAPRGTKKSGGKQAVASRMEVSMVWLLCAPCTTAEQDVLYNNPPADPPCPCSTCDTPPLPFESPPAPACNCSGCMPEPAPLAKEKTRAADTNPIPRGQRLTRKMQAKGMQELVALRIVIYLSADTASSCSFPPEAFFSDMTIKLIFDRFAHVDTAAVLQELVKGRTLLVPYLGVLWKKVEELRGSFDVMCAETKAKMNARQAKRWAQKKMAMVDSVTMESVDGAAKVSRPLGKSRYSQAALEGGGDDSLLLAEVDVLTASFEWWVEESRYVHRVYAGHVLRLHLQGRQTVAMEW